MNAPSDEMKRFDTTMKKILSVSKAELQRRLEEERANRIGLGDTLKGNIVKRKEIGNV